MNCRCWTDEEQAYSALRAVLHAVRDRLTVDEATDLAAQLPMVVRGFYYEGWKPALAPNKERTVEEFLDHVGSSLTGNSTIDPGTATPVILQFLDRQLSGGKPITYGRCCRQRSLTGSGLADAHFQGHSVSPPTDSADEPDPC